MTQESKHASRGNSFEIENLIKVFFIFINYTLLIGEIIFNSINFSLQSAGEVTGFCRSPEPARRSPTVIVSAVQNPPLTIGRQLTDAEKLRKVISELVDTEKSYIKVYFVRFFIFILKQRISYEIIKFYST